METCLQIFKLKFECNQSNRTIAAALRVSPSTVYEVLSRFTAASLSWPLPDALLPEKLEKMLFPTRRMRTSELIVGWQSFLDSQGERWISRKPFTGAAYSDFKDSGLVAKK
ncbi:hypothetical protein AAH678_03540 [Sodalis endosymbiont of Spalangia cameroni]|uniref:hypothetical protein n=1 Tax=Sodalis praecaptivus TaxID=1239307 RepID=UPI0031F955D6